MTDLAPWLAVAGLGAYHGINPAMGWLFAVALGMHRGSRRIVYLSLIPIALGHALSLAVVAGAVVALGLVIDHRVLSRLGGAVLLAWAAYHALYGHRRRVRVGMQTGMAGLALWSFLMATGHGAGLMLVPLIIPLCISGDAAQAIGAGDSLALSLAVIGLHMAAMLAVTGAVAAIVYDRIGLAFLRRGWINLDAIWVAALALAGLILLI